LTGIDGICDLTRMRSISGVSAQRHKSSGVVIIHNILWNVPLVAIQVQLFCAASLLDVWVLEQSLKISLKFGRWGERKSAVVNEDIGRSEKPCKL
jgi:hypothetical protein